MASSEHLPLQGRRVSHVCPYSRNHTKLEKKDELIQTVRQEILPILLKQPGFLELLPFVPEVVNERVVAITLWTEKYHAEKYVNEVFPKVEKILKPFLTAPVTCKMYKVETTLCEHFVGALTAAV